jgi:MFS family permease
VLDRQVLSLLVGPIKRDLALSDFEIGLLQGAGFAVLYSIASFPIGWFVDRYPRRLLVWAGVTLWALSASFCGMARGFASFVIARMGVGIGEAALMPAAYSILADLFRPSRLAFALAIMLVGGAVGGGAAVGLSGTIVGFAEAGHGYQLPFVGPIAAWRFALIVTGIPGSVLGALIFLIREPDRRNRLRATMSLSETFRFIRERRALLVCLLPGLALQSIVVAGFVSWFPTYMIRVFGWSVSQTSLALALIISIGPSLGALATGWLIDSLFGAGRTDAHLRVTALVILGASFIGVAAFQINRPWFFLALAFPLSMTLVFAPPTAAALQIIAPSEMRGQMGAIVTFIVSGVGPALGPTLVGALSDFVFHDEARVGTSIALLLGTLGPISAVLFGLGMKPMREAVRLAQISES